MASNIQLASTVVAPTGTGFLFYPFQIDGNAAIFKQSAPSGRAAVLSFKRTQPKPTPTFAGVERGEVKLVEYTTIDGVEYQTIYALNTSVPVPVADAQRTAQKDRIAIVAAGSDFLNLVRYNLIPQ